MKLKTLFIAMGTCSLLGISAAAMAADIIPAIEPSPSGNASSDRASVDLQLNTIVLPNFQFVVIGSNEVRGSLNPDKAASLGKIALCLYSNSGSLGMTIASSTGNKEFLLRSPNNDAVIPYKVSLNFSDSEEFGGKSVMFADTANLVLYPDFLRSQGNTCDLDKVGNLILEITSDPFKKEATPAGAYSDQITVTVRLLGYLVGWEGEDNRNITPIREALVQPEA